jgi:hypothetical protein
MLYDEPADGDELDHAAPSYLYCKRLTSSHISLPSMSFVMSSHRKVVKISFMSSHELSRKRCDNGFNAAMNQDLPFVPTVIMAPITNIQSRSCDSSKEMFP